MLIRKYITFDPETCDEVDAERAKKPRRTFTAEVITLVEEALTARKKLAARARRSNNG